MFLCGKKVGDARYRRITAVAETLIFACERCYVRVRLFLRKLAAVELPIVLKALVLIPFKLAHVHCGFFHKCYVKRAYVDQ